MTMEEKMGGSNREDEALDRFPVGMRVLAVDDDPICLKVLGTLLLKCQYQVTTTNQAISALKMLRENRNRYDLVISDVNMPDMDGFKLLELVGLEMDLPVIMLSAHSDTKLVMKGITHGACDYLLKPVRIEELKNIWQHVVRRKKPDSKDRVNGQNQDKASGGIGEAVQTSTSSSDQKFNKKRKDQNEDEEDDGEDNEHENDDPSTQKKPRVVWSVELHRKFVAAVNHLGLDKAVPKKILDLMNVEGLTRENVASHLQKYRLYLKRLSSVATQQANMVAALGGKDPSYLRMGSLDGFGDFRTLTGSGRLSSASLSSYQPSGMFGRLNSSAALNLRGISSGVIQQGHPQTLSNSINGLGKIQPVGLPANQNQNGTLFQGIPTSIELNQLLQNKSANHFGELNPVNNPNVFGVATNFPDARMTVGSSTSSLSTPSGSPLLLQANTQQAQRSGAFGNQSSLDVASLNQESFDMGVHGFSNFVDNGRCHENWQNTVQLSSFPSNSLSTCEAFSHEQLHTNNLQESISWRSSHLNDNPIDLSASMANAGLEDSRGDMQCQISPSNNVIHNIDYAAKQQWGENSSFAGADSLVAGAPYVQHLEAGKLAFNTKLRSNEDILFEQRKPQNEFSQNNFETLDVISSPMIKPEQYNETGMMEGELGYDSFPLGSCI
ncbi:hypothetical protein Godav_016859 [Gossypium davidsonii]|uniref:Two-component response regulator n=1 Tax=Gossypium davidsonii TaxID=34287 RepID=A0A7J8QRG6_GOSDV|nr:hypothetical protein [Gossypium davidsonii]